MEHQDWTTVTLKRRSKEPTSIIRDSERARLAKIEAMDDTILPKKRIHPESIQALIRKRIELSLNQEKADQKCSFAKHTFKELEANRLIPNQAQQSAIQKHFGVQLKIELTH
uniref:HTH cro/C1-type domain-containing protein n=1 Tax=viral metagenome TaxID=1070528 RepID=A0A6C0KSA4_9ZZZZ